jgi:hypothetical protein
MMDDVVWHEIPAAKDAGDGLPYATHEGELRFGGFSIRCFTLNDGRRLLDADQVNAFFEAAPTSPAAVPPKDPEQP